MMQPIRIVFAQSSGRRYSKWALLRFPSWIIIPREDKEPTKVANGKEIQQFIR